MDRVRFELLEELVTEALTLPPEERRGFVIARCEDTALREEALDLLEQSDRAEDLDKSPIFSEPRIPKRVGAYRVERMLARGGLSVVYLAEREQGFRQRVALKVVEGMLGSREVEERFRREREILARLDHPSIARLVDAGLVEGTPYLATEYVEGEPITKYCAGQPAEAKLRLFLQVCEAVQYAHQRMVLHRDLKPAHVLVTAEGKPKLLDFGIGKVLRSEASADQTALGLRWMTLNYASPEQILGGSITTASDTYSLGLILYELLTGNALRRWTGMGLEEVLERLRSPLPVAGLGDRELGAVLRKALAYEVGGRYPTPAALAADIERYIGGFPVLAEPANWWRQSGSFARRHRWGVVATGVGVVGALCAGMMIVGQSQEALKQKQEADRQRTVAIREKQVALEERTRAEQNRLAAEAATRESERRTAEALSALERARTAEREAEASANEVRKLAYAVIFQIEPAIASLPNSTKVRKQLVEEGLQYLDRLTARPEMVKGNLWGEVASGYWRLARVQGLSQSSANLGDPVGAMASMRKAVRAAEVYRSQRPDEVKRVVLLMDMRSDLAMARAGDRNELLAEVEKDAVWLQRHAPEDAKGLEARARLAFAKRDLRAYLTLSERLLEKDNSSTTYLRNVALGHKYLATEPNVSMQERLGHCDEAIRLDTQLLAQNPESTDAKLDLSFDWSQKGTVLRATGDHRGAAEAYGRVVELRRELHAKDASNDRVTDRLATSLVMLGSMQFTAGMEEAGQASLDEALHVAAQVKAPGRAFELRAFALMSRVGENARGAEEPACSLLRQAEVSLAEARRALGRLQPQTEDTWKRRAATREACGIR